VTTKWDGFSLLAFDLESTGIDVFKDRIVTAALVDVPAAGRPVATSYVTDPGIEVPEAAAAVHGYSRARAIAEQTHTVEQLLFEVTGRIALRLGKGQPLVGFNLAYDLTLLEAECQRHGVDTLASRLGGPGAIAPILDVFVLDKHASRRRGKRQLPIVCQHYGVVHTGAHDSTGDALAAARLFPRVMATPGKFPGMTLAALHQAQVGWRREQCDSLREYFDREGKPHDGVPGDWPVQMAVYEQAGAELGAVS
jgi:DNA polymerase-3 subunit epsilon